MIHGDFHIKNIMMQNGEMLLIDMDTLCYGHPIFELAAMYNAYYGFELANNSENFLGIPWETAHHIWDKALSLYLDTEDEARLKDVTEKAALIGAARLLRRFIKRRNQDNGVEDNDVAIENYRKRLYELMDQYDTLLY